ncbi:FAD-dependent monooxygenase [Kibdelosporangium phytohabitans]|uniref:Pentachlorophenol monooxygenase n=1 Tax=Kibdelosporangium phytohabitans TaxID=860235 RepID=A0A0N9I5U4_9PSEU|nr:FAD-dependent monooxygenase [Kibdelosporangium phytohabitans]ALG10248.1 pentachlorophenol monooxygenase [Kibdelosporangium phytohabitans]MBE1461274.1 pentachlorophenol monooxygenase/3-(3-hydroxy-phenyl)propionate hydroxylase [Kibdelosporangium phytohabitans]
MSVVVVGNGPVGQTTALLLARWGVPSVLLDGRPARDPVGSKSICQQRDVLDIWHSVGAGARIAAEGLTWRTARTFYQDTELFAVDLPAGGTLPPFVNLSQARTEEILDSWIARQPLVDVRWDHHVTGLEQDADGVTVTCAGGQGVRGSHVVLCAGARAEDLRSALGVTFDGRSFDDQFLICDIRADLPDWAHERRFYFDPPWNPGRQVLIHPCPGSTFRIDWQVPAGYAVQDDDLDGRIRAILGEADYSVIWRSVYRFHSRVASRLRVGRVLLAGDCAHLMAPFGARGLNSGVADAENAAWKIAFVVQGKASTDLLETYHAERHAAATENLRVTGETMDFLVPRDDAQHRRRLSVLEQARHDPSVHPKVNSGRLSEPHPYRDSPLTHGSHRAAGLLVPEQVRAVARDGLQVVRYGDPMAEKLGVRPGEIWVIRPDAYVAAVVTSDAELDYALARF